MGRSNMEQHKFYCIQCGQEGVPLARKRNRQRERFHRKVMYCYHCHEDINHIECRDEEDVRIFKENFNKGVFLNECKESLDHVRSSRLGKVNLVL